MNLRRAENRLMKTIRDPRAAEAVAQAPLPFSVAALHGHRYVLLITTRRDGRDVATPMWFAADGEHRIVLRSGAGDPKLDRIWHEPRVRIAPCDIRGRPLGPPMQGRARILGQEEKAHAEQLLKRALGWQRRLYSLVREPLLSMAYIEVTGTEVR